MKEDRPDDIVRDKDLGRSVLPTLFGGAVIVAALYYGQELTVPLVLAALLALVRDLPAYVRRQDAGEWHDTGGGTLQGRRALVMGAGDLGTNVRDRLAPFGVDVLLSGSRARDGVLGPGDVDAVLPFLTAQRPVMEATLVALRDRHESIDAYLTGPAGLDATTLIRLRDVLLHTPNP